MSQPPRLTERLDMLFDADFRELMDQRRRRREPTMSPTACFAIAAALVNHADGDGRCWPSQARIASHASSSRRTAQLALAILEDEGVVEVERRHHRAGIAKGDEANRYRLNWTRLAQLRRVRRTGANLAHDDEAPLLTIKRETRARSGARLAHEQARDLQGSGASPAPEQARDSRTEPYREPPMEPPPPTPGGGGGVESAPVGPQDGGVTDAEVELILAAYPGPGGPGTHPEAKYDRDAAAVRAAIAREAGVLTPPMSPAELLAAVESYARHAGAGRTPTVMPWVWLRDRGYYGTVVTTRLTRRNRPQAPRASESLLEQSRRDQDAHRRSLDSIDSTLGELSAEELEQLKRRVLETVPRTEYLRGSDPRKSPMLRQLMHDLLSTNSPIASCDRHHDDAGSSGAAHSPGADHVHEVREEHATASSDRAA